MRIWSIHPQYLDSKGLVALWRETLLAKHVLEGKTKGYTHHPQLNRFKEASAPLKSINHYLAEIYKEALSRGYNFDKSKFRVSGKIPSLTVTKGQIEYEFEHLLAKLKKRDRAKYLVIKEEQKVIAHPLFKVVKGKVEEWEVV